MPTSTAWRCPRAALALGAALALCDCHSLGTQSTATALTIAGDWRADAAHSDNFEVKLAALLDNQRRRMQPRHGATEAHGSSADGHGGSVSATASADVGELAAPLDDPAQVRARLGDDLRPASELRIAFAGEALEITRDAEPVRRFQPGQSVSRIDSSGAASLESGWDGNAFVIRARYTNHATRSWRLEHDTAADSLRVTFEANSPEFGKLALQTVYRRAAASTP